MIVDDASRHSDGTTRRFARALDALLSAYDPGDAREIEFRKRMLELNREPRAVERTHFDPGHFTASAFVLSPNHDAVLLIFHRKLEKWLQPGGHIEGTDASPEASARREILEEVGLSDLALPEGPSLFDIDIHAIPARPREPEHQHFDLRFLFQATSARFSATHEVADARWAALSEVSRVTRDESVLRAVRKIGTRTRD